MPSAALPAEPPARPHVAIERLRFAQGGRMVFEGLTLELRERRVGLVGANGAGKSSLLRLIHGLALPEAGQVLTVGLDTATRRQEIPGRVGYLFQSPDRQIIFPTVGEEIAFEYELRGAPRREAERQAEACLTRFGRAAWMKRLVQELSEGERQLVCLIAVLAREPALLLLDEPFASLDLRTRLAFAARLAALPIPLVMASHDLDFLSDFDRILWMEPGGIRADGPPAQVLPAYEAAMRAASREAAS